MQKWSETTLVRGLREGCPAVTTYYFHYLFRQAERRLLYPAARERRELLEDCFSEAFLVLCDKLQADCYRPGKLDAFALGIVHRCFRDALRGEWRKILKQEDHALVVERMYTAAERATDLAALFDHYDHNRHLQWYENLPARDQQLLDLRLRGYDQKESAELLGLAHGTVRNRYQRLMSEARALNV